MPRRAGLDDGGAVDGPALEHLAKALDARDGVGSRDRQAVPDVEGSRRVKLSVEISIAIERNDVAAAGTLTGIDGQSVREGVTGGQGQAVEVSGGKDGLQPIVI